MQNIPLRFSDQCEKNVLVLIFIALRFIPQLLCSATSCRINLQPYLSSPFSVLTLRSSDEQTGHFVWWYYLDLVTDVWFCDLRDCLGARDPYCGWDRKQKSCTTIEDSSNMSQWSQDIIKCPVRHTFRQYHHTWNKNHKFHLFIISGVSSIQKWDWIESKWRFLIQSFA